MTEDDIRRSLTRWGIVFDPVDYTEALLEELARTHAVVRWLDRAVADLDDEGLTWGRSSEVDKGSGEFPGTDTTYTAGQAAMIKMWQDERKHLVDVSAACAKANIDERRTRMHEAYGVRVGTVIAAILDAMLSGLLTELERFTDFDASAKLRSAWPVIVGEVVPAELARIVVEDGAP